MSGRKPTRSRPQSPARRKIILGCEGKETEPKYFNALRILLRLPAERVEILPHDKPDPRNVVEVVVAKKNNLKSNGRWGEGDQVWAVFDGDYKDKLHHDEWNAILSLAGRNGIHLAITNPCIELWFLLHFQDQWAPIASDGAESALKKHLPNFEKSCYFCPDPFEERTMQALSRAERIARRAEAEEAEPHRNPCAEGVAKLVCIILRFATD